MSLLKLVNVFFFQWLFIRLTKCVDNDNGDYWYSIMYFVVPISGWFSFAYVPHQNNLIRITPYLSK